MKALILALIILFPNIANAACGYVTECVYGGTCTQKYVCKAEPPVQQPLTQPKPNTGCNKKDQFGIPTYNCDWFGGSND